MAMLKEAVAPSQPCESAPCRSNKPGLYKVTGNIGTLEKKHIITLIICEDCAKPILAGQRAYSAGTKMAR